MKGSLKGIGFAILISSGVAFTAVIHPGVPAVICFTAVIVLFGFMFYDGGTN